jgi:Flp pilus assembly protein TadG
MAGGRQTPERTTRQRHRLLQEHGVALVEFALVAPLLMLLLFGMVDFGRAFNYWIDETHLANTGARWAVVNKNPGSPPNVVCVDATTVCLQEYIVSEADTGELQSKAEACIDFPAAALDEANEPGDYSVTVTVRMESPFEWLQIVGLAPRHITSKSTMRLEKRPTNYTTGCFG